MDLFKKDRKPSATYQEMVGGGSTVAMFTTTRGDREFTTSLSVDEIEDLIRSEDELRKKK